MNWSDERYVKLYVRKTATWITWPWEARAVFPSMLKEADGAGLIDVGSRDPVRTLSVMILMPYEVVAPAVAAMLDTGTIEATDRGFLISRYIEAQEATKTDSRRKQDQRERQRAQVRATTKAGVTGGHEESRAVPLQPSPAQPSSTTTTISPPPPDQLSPPPAQRRRRAEQAQLPVIPAPAPKPPTRIGALHKWFTEERAGRLTDAPPYGLGLAEAVPDEEPKWAQSAATLSKWIAALPPGFTDEEQDSMIRAMMGAWLEEPYWAEPPSGVPYPWGALLSEKQWRKAFVTALPALAEATH